MDTYIEDKNLDIFEKNQFELQKVSGRDSSEDGSQWRVVHGVCMNMESRTCSGKCWVFVHFFLLVRVHVCTYECTQAYLIVCEYATRSPY